MRRTVGPALATLSLCFACLAADPLASQPTSATGSQPTRVVTSADSGRIVVVPVGTMVSVRLQGNLANTGWETTAVNGGVLEYVTEKFDPAKDASDPAIGTYTFDYKAAKTGQVTLQFSYIAPGGPAVKQRLRSALVASLTVTVVVPDAAAATTQPVDEKAVAALIRQLGDDDFKTRESATAKLIDMCKTVHILLDKAQQTPKLDPEIASRIQTVLKKTVTATSSTQATDEATGITVSLGEGGKVLTATQGGKMIWKVNLPVASESLEIQDHRFVGLLPSGMIVDLRTGQLKDR
jgi:predicted secreted protein